MIMKKFYLSPFMIRHLFISVTFLCSLGHFNAHADDLHQQRWQFNHAIDALKTHDLENFQQFSLGLQDYPLYYYLRYLYLQPRLKQVDFYEIQTFLKQYGNSHFGELLRKQWLYQLAKTGDWTTFLQFYTSQQSTDLQCYYAYARFVTGQQTHADLLKAKKLWLVGKSQPKACDSVFEYLYQSNLIDDALILERIGLAMKKGRLSLASALTKRLEPDERVWITRWQTMHRKPAQTLANFTEPDLPVVREIILHGIRRLAKKQFELADNYWNTFQRAYAFSIQQIGEMQRDLALASVKHEHPQALKWLTAVNKNYLNDKLNTTRIKLALREQNWRAVADFITELPKQEQKSLRWRYWLARAFEQMKKFAQARKTYEELAQERDYYGFLAADRINAPYKMQHHPIAFTPADQTKLMKHISIAGAYEFYNLSQLEDNKWLFKARKEWQYVLKHLSPRLQAIAAALASRWGWHDRAIMAAAKAGHYDDLDVRFPLAYYDQLANGATGQNIDLPWVYGIVRQESAFMTQIRSSAGALGLMQLMPATGRFVAKKLGLKLRNRQDILDIDTNISLGTAYLRQMLNRFNGNHMLATAAYNAGPNRAKRWAKENSCVPADIWVELIPFKETRNYVRRVLFYTRIFETRLGQKTRPLRVALAPNENCTFQYYTEETEESQNTSNLDNRIVVLGKE